MQGAGLSARRNAVISSPRHHVNGQTFVRATFAPGRQTCADKAGVRSCSADRPCMVVPKAAWRGDSV